MFRRYPYWGWLLLTVLLWCATWIHYHHHLDEARPAKMAQTLNKDLRKRIAAYDSLMKDQALMRRLFTDSVREADFERVNALPFHIYCYDHDSLKFWNNNAIIGRWNDSLLNSLGVVNNEHGVFVQTCIRPEWLGWHRKLVVLFPVEIRYPPQLENDYLKTHFVAADHIPVSSEILAPNIKGKDTYAVTLENGTPIYNIVFAQAEAQKWKPDDSFLIVLLAALIATISWLHLMILYLTRNLSAVPGFFITLALILGFRISLYAFGLPFGLDTLDFFSPSLYASSRYLASFGDLFINTMCSLWLVIFVTRHTPYKEYFAKVKGRVLRFAIATALMVATIGYLFFFVDIVRSLVLDSSISFDVSHSVSVNIYTVWGLLVIASITGMSCLLIYLANIQFNVLLRNNIAKYVLVALIALVLTVAANLLHDSLLGPFDWVLYLSLSAWMILYMALLDVPRLALVSDLLEPHMIFWALFICAFCTQILHYFSDMKEQSARVSYVEQQLSPKRDNVMEYAFDKTIGKIESDHELKSFFSKPTAVGRKHLNQRFDSLYLTGPVTKYDTRLYFYDANGRGLFNGDSTTYPELVAEKNESVSTSSPYLFYKESILDKHYYLSYVRIYSDTINNIVGYVIVDLDLKKPLTQTVNTELLQQNSNKASEKNMHYSYAVYINNKLVSQTNDYPFTTRLTNDTIKEGHHYFYESNGYSELQYKLADKLTVIVVHPHSDVMETATLFSYIFGIQVLIAAIIFLYQVYLSYFTRTSTKERVLRLTLRKRVHFSMLAIIMVSCVLIGVATIFFFRYKYGENNSGSLQAKMQIARQAIQQDLKSGNAFSNSRAFDSVCQSPVFRNNIALIANSQGIDINIYNDDGILFATSQEDIYNKGLTSRMMRPDAYYKLGIEGKSMVVQTEHIARLSYLSDYEPLRNEHGVTLGYINVPLFSSEKDLNAQISNIVIAFINFYALIFLISGLMAVFITGWITRSFNLIIEQLRRINLRSNERITWPYEDEIGTLVTEYNKMVNKVEENAALLAQSEREMAWREMARQVAHEIKNPLTPMKLNIQYLQQAIKNDNPNIKQLTARVSESIIEQIDNLTYIASEFSNFAKMPEARPEELELGELLNKAAELYTTEQRVNVTLNASEEELNVFSDRSQLLRVFTNLLENAKQAIPEDRMGVISISLTQDNSEALVAITDNGIGINEEVAQRIFQPYFTTKTSGTGLGLAMTKKIIEFWKGQIWFETVEGEGTTFFIRLPLVKK